MVEMGRSCQNEEGSVFKIFTLISTGKRPLLGRPRCRWEDNNGMDLKK